MFWKGVSCIELSKYLFLQVCTLLLQLNHCSRYVSCLSIFSYTSIWNCTRLNTECDELNRQVYVRCETQGDAEVACHISQHSHSLLVTNNNHCQRSDLCEPFGAPPPMVFASVAPSVATTCLVVARQRCTYKTASRVWMQQHPQALVSGEQGTTSTVMVRN